MALEVETLLTGGDGNDVFQFADTTNLNAAATLIGGNDSDTIHLTTADIGIEDADFDKVTTVETLKLTGISTAVLGTNADAAATGTLNIETGNDTTSITGANDKHFTIDATSLANGKVLTLADNDTASNFTVTNLRRGYCADEFSWYAYRNNCR